MAEIRIRRLETKYRLPHSARAERRRLDELRTEVVGRAFSMAMERVGLADGELCLRNLSTKVSLPLHATDQSLVAHWSAVMADEIVRVISNASSLRTVVYHSRRQALMDFAISIGRGDLRRAWAWRQMGLWQSRSGTSESQAFFELVHSLCSEPAMIVPVLRVMAEAGSLSRLSERLTEEQWAALAFAVLSEIGAGNLLHELSALPSARAVREARKLINRSLLLHATIASPVASDLCRRSIAALVIAEVEPALLRTKTAAAVIKIIADSCAQSSIDHIADREEQHSTDLAKPGETPPAAGQLPHESDNTDNTNDDLKPLDLRQRILTRWGGLLFLCGVLEDLNIPDFILDHPLLSRRPFSWVLHQLALNLVATAPDDPAALVFAGLPVKAKPPSKEEAPASEQETEALRAIVSAIDERLSSLLDFQDEAPANVIDFVCHRRAEIVADPGWIELRFSLDDVSTELRRAGLDLDPGYVSYLGFVLKFAYE